MRARRSEKEDNKFTRFIRERIRVAREEHGMSQEDLAKYIYKTRVTVSDMERGRVQVGILDLSLIAAALEKPISYFFPVQVRGIQAGELTPDEQELVHFYRQIAHKPLQLIALKQVRTLAESAIEADMETERQALEQYGFDDE